MEKSYDNYVYYLCLINWNKVLTNEEMDEFKKNLVKIDNFIKIDDVLTEDWLKFKLDWENDNNLKDELSESKLGFYHSRLIFWFKLKRAPETVTEARSIRLKLEDKIIKLFENEIIGEIKEIINQRDNKLAKLPLIFIYPIFEVNRKERFWALERKRPFSLPTTCFFTKLDDKKKKEVELRISGAKIITMNMSDWFFEILVNIVFHEGLYRQTREKELDSQTGEIYVGLENRLEDFASKLMTIFHQYSTTYSGSRLRKIAVRISIFSLVIALFSLITAIISLVITIINFF